jgi:hypothetical protein
LDAIPAQKLRQLVEDTIKEHMPDRFFDFLIAQEASERDQLDRIVGVAPDWMRSKTTRSWARDAPSS